MDLKQFEILYKTYQPKLVNFAFFYLKNEEEAIDIVQELFLNIWEQKQTKLWDDNPKPYLLTSVRNRCYNHLTRKKPNTGLLDEVIISQESVQANMEAKEIEKTIMSAINNLPDRCKEIFWLSRFEQLGYKEISVMLNLSVKTVENQISNALKYIRKNL